MRNYIADTGISTAYAPENCHPIVDIVIIHGLHGHPFKTWTSLKVQHSSTTPSPLSLAISSGAQYSFHSGKSIVRRTLSKFSQKWSKRTSSSTNTEQGTSTPTARGGVGSATVFWPADLLPIECPNARILMYGYNSKITRYMRGATAKNSLLSHGKDLLFSLCRERTRNCPLIFIGHSLGGIIVKEALARSAASTDSDLKNIIESTRAIIFFGTPHRGSPELAALGEYLRTLVSSLRIDTAPAMLDALGLKSTDLERAQEVFSSLWDQYNFRVKTFQEGLGLTGIRLGALGNKVVPDYSSLIGDHRERAETLQANHKEMCRFSGANDANYRKFAAEIRSIYNSIVASNVRVPGGDQSITGNQALLSDRSRRNIGETEDEVAALQSLWFPGIYTRHQTLQRPAEHTCHWLFEHELYQQWINCTDSNRGYGLLWLKGKPGAGKSILMKEAFRRALLRQGEPGFQTAAFFFSATGNELENRSIGLFRSLLYQLLPKTPACLNKFTEMWTKRKLGYSSIATNDPFWEVSELKDFFHWTSVQNLEKTTFIFIDGLDECDPKSTRDLAYFWREITYAVQAKGIRLYVCISSRHFPSITVSDCPEIVLEDHNRQDIDRYIQVRLKLAITSKEPQWQLIKRTILDKSAGVFLWVVLVVDDVLQKWDEGKDIRQLLRRLDVVPEALGTLFSEMFLSIHSEQKRLTVRFFQWAVLAAKPLRLHEWHHVMALVRYPAISSLQEWRTSENFIQNDDQLERQIRSISRGLVGIDRAGIENLFDIPFETVSVFAEAGSLSVANGETRLVQVIHESVRDFFLHGSGFYILDPSLGYNPIGNGHLSIMRACLQYLNISELDDLIRARDQALDRENSPPHGTHSQGLELGRNHSHPSLSPVNLSKDRGILTLAIRTGAPEGDISIVDTLTTSPKVHSMVDITQWMNFMDSDQMSLCFSANESSTNISVSAESQVLEDYPALLSYATFELFTHAKLAQNHEADPRPIINYLKDGDAWNRWRTLNEDASKDLNLRSCATAYGLHTWLEILEPHFRTLELNLLSIRIPTALNTSGGEGQFGSEDGLIRRTSSVASFGSASSHTGTALAASDSDNAVLSSPQPISMRISRLHKKSNGKHRSKQSTIINFSQKPETIETAEGPRLVFHPLASLTDTQSLYCVNCLRSVHKLEKLSKYSYHNNDFKYESEVEQHQASCHVRRHSFPSFATADYNPARGDSLTRTREENTGISNWWAAMLENVWMMNGDVACLYSKLGQY